MYRLPAACLLALLLTAACTDDARVPTGNSPDPTTTTVVLERVAPNPDRTATVGAHFLFDVMQGGSTFRYTGTKPLQVSVVFDPMPDVVSVVNGVVSGVSNSASSINVYVRASASGAEAADTFAIAVSALPVRLMQGNTVHHATVGVPFSYDPTHGGTAFSDPHDTGLQYETTFLTPSNGLSASGARVVGTPVVPGTVLVRVSARDGHGSSASDEFEIKVHGGDELVVVSPNDVQAAYSGKPFNYDASKNGALLNKVAGSYTITLTPAIPGLHAEGARIVGTPTAPGIAHVRVTAAEGSSSAIDEFPLVVFSASVGEPALPSAHHAYAPPRANIPAHFLAQTPIGERNPLTDAGATLGRVLFYDPRLSSGDQRSCSSCHRQQFGFGDSTRVAASLTSAPVTRHSMALANSRFHLSGRFFWDERAASLEAAVLQPIQDPREMGMPLPDLITKLNATPFYKPLFADAFGSEDITAERVAFALAQFIRSMVSANSKFDLAFAGGAAPDFNRVFTQEERRGKELFETVLGCAECHELNTQVSDNVHNTGLDASVTDEGAGRGRFRVPSLRNVAVRGRYMHDGRFRSLEEVIDFYDAGVQPNPFLDPQLRFPNGAPLRRGLDAFDRAALIAFLHTLTDSTFLTDPKFSNPFHK